MPVQETSKIALEKLKDAPITQKVFEAILDIGPTHNNRILEYLIQKEKQRPHRERRKWQINQICGRVHDLIHMHSLVRDLGPHRGSWYGKAKTYHIWVVIGDSRQPVGWRPVSKKDIPRQGKSKTQIRAGLEQLREKVEQRIVNALECSKKTTASSNQALLF